MMIIMSTMINIIRYELRLMSEYTNRSSKIMKKKNRRIVLRINNTHQVAKSGILPNVL